MAQLVQITIILLPILYVYTAIGYELIQCPKVPIETTEYIYFAFYYGPTLDNYTYVQFEDALTIASEKAFKKSASTVLYLPGVGTDPTKHDQSIDAIAAAFLTKGNVNLIVVDYHELQKSNGSHDFIDYVSSVGNITVIGEALACFLHKFVPEVQPLDLIHLVGHSLGAQIMSRTAIAYGRGKLPWLTGLDPAGPLFNIPSNEISLSKGDGKFVDVIHTDAYIGGEAGSLGDADFFPNKGIRIQPYCVQHPAALCSHYTAWRYYAASVVYETIFPAQKCQVNLICFAFNLSWCCSKDAASIAYMGYGVSKTANGNFYLKTGSEYPFGLGDKGLYAAVVDNPSIPESTTQNSGSVEDTAHVITDNFFNRGPHRFEKNRQKPSSQ